MVAKEKSLTKKSKTTASRSGYTNFIAHLKSKIRSSQLKAVMSVNREMILLYWDIGKDIVERQKKDGWGAKVIERVARDLQNEFPGIEGFSRTNIGRMKAFYLTCPIYPQAVGKLEDLPFFNIPWGHNIVIFESAKNLNERIWYANTSTVDFSGLFWPIFDSFDGHLFSPQRTNT